MAPRVVALAGLLLATFARGQQIGTAVPESAPKLSTQRCTVSGGCKPVTNAFVLDAFIRPLHRINDTSAACNVGTAPCDNASSCGKSCALEGVDYAARGVKTSGDALTLHQWVKQGDGSYATVSPRGYLLAADGEDYEMMNFLNTEFSFDVDVSTLPCGMNAALYAGEMNRTGGRSELNPAGAKYGTGYCDAQCPKLGFINGVVSIVPFRGSLLRSRQRQAGWCLL